MAENYGLMTGIANGIKEGMLAYQTQKQINRQNDLTNLLQGVETDPETGGLRYTSQKQKEIDFQNQKIAFEQEKLKREGGLLDPSTDLSKAYGKFASDYSGTPIPEQMSGLDVKGLLPSLGNKLKAESMYQTAQTKANMDEQLKAMLAGMEKDPKTGKFVYTPQKQAEIDFKQHLENIKIEQEKNKQNMLQDMKEKGYDLEKFKAGAVSTPEGKLTMSDQKIAEIAEKQRLKNEEMQLKKDSLKSTQELRKAQIKKLTSDAKKGPGLDFESKLLLTGLVKKKAQLIPVVDKFNQYIKQLEDPSISESQKLQAANQTMKLMNDPDNPDAAGVEEVKRVGSFLSAGPDPFGPKGMKFGADIKGFTQAIKNSRDRSANTLNNISADINEITGKQKIEKKGLIGSEKTYSSDVVNYARSHGITNEQALAIKNKRGGK